MPDGLQRRVDRFIPHVSPRVLAAIAALVVAGTAWGLSHQQTSAFRNESREHDQQQQLAQRAACARGNVLRAMRQIEHPREDHLVLILDCAATVRSKAGVVPASDAVAAELRVQVRACVEAADRSGLAVPWCRALINGQVAGDAGSG